MIFSLCDKVALYVAGKKGFCGTHKAEAYAQTAKDKRLITSRVAIGDACGASHSARTGNWQGWDFDE